MGKDEIEKVVAGHYTRGDVTDKIFKALGLQPADQGRVSVESLFPMDQLHHGGVGLTEKMATSAGISHGMKVLDAGCGIGGSSRFLVDRFSCVVEAIDLSEEFVDTAQELDKIVGLTSNITHRVGSVTKLPYHDNTFDVVWSQNVSMNVPDKHGMFTEAYRVLRPGGVYVLSHIGESNRGVIDYPLPWAMSPETSFAMPPDAVLQLLSDVGFDSVRDHAEGEPPAAPPPSPAGQPEDVYVMGEDMPLRRTNSGRAVKDGRLVPMLVTAYR